MPVVACPQCGGQVSTQAPACPHCGAPRRAPGASPWKIIGIIVLVLVMLPVLGCLAAIALPAYQDYMQRSEEARANAGAPAAPASPAAPEFDARACSTGDVLVRDVAGRIEHYAIFVTGVLENRCARPAGPRVKLTVYDESGHLLGTREFWPASVSNIEPGGTYPFEMQLDKYAGAARFEASVIEVQTWK